jgi:hypothetical protein
MTKLEKLIALSALLLCAALLTVSVWLVVKGKDPVADEFVPPEMQTGTVKGFPDVLTEEMRFVMLPVGGEFTVGLCTNAPLRDGRLYLYFTSHEENDVLLRITVSDEDGTLLGETGLIKPNCFLPDLALSSEPRGSKLSIRVISYEEGTYYSRGTTKLTISYEEK